MSKLNRNSNNDMKNKQDLERDQPTTSLCKTKIVFANVQCQVYDVKIEAPKGIPSRACREGEY